MTSRDPRADRDGLEATPVDPSPSLRLRVLASTTPATRFAGFTARFARIFDLSEERAAEVLRETDEERLGGWQAMPDLRMHFLHFQGGERLAGIECGLVRVEPGTRFPTHRHPGEEWVFVLAGSAREEETGDVWLPGDLVIREAGSRHAYHTLDDGPYVFAVVLRDGIEFVEGGIDAPRD